MENQNNITGAVRRFAGFPNNTLAAIIAAIASNQIAIANDRNAIIHTDNEGNACKTMSGEATDDDNFTFTAIDMQLPLPFTFKFGDQTSNGSMRFTITTDNFKFEKRISGSWVELGAFF